MTPFLSEFKLLLHVDLDSVFFHLGTPSDAENALFTSCDNCVSCEERDGAEHGHLALFVSHYF